MQDIDFVITWVDGNDPVWQRNKALYQGKEIGDFRLSRYRDWETLRFLLRGIDKFAPWVHKVFLVTCGHYPDWLNLENDKLILVKHEDFIPSKYLPTFSCRPIEFNLHRIPGLSENFVYFNDDMLIMQPVKKEDFFRNGLPCDSAILDATTVTAQGRNGEKMDMESLYTSLVLNTAVINRNFKKKTVLRKNFTKWFSYRYGLNALRTLLLFPWGEFTGFKSTHLPYSYTKSSFTEVWEIEGELLEKACEHKFRTPLDVSSRLISDWQIVEGNFSPRSPEVGRLFYISNDDKNNEELFRVIRSQKYKLLCINDEYSGDSFEKIKNKLIKSFEYVFENKCSFEVQ